MPYALCPMPYAPLTKRLIQQALDRAGCLLLSGTPEKLLHLLDRQLHRKDRVLIPRANRVILIGNS